VVAAADAVLDGFMIALLAVAACGTGVTRANPTAQTQSGQARAVAANSDLDPGTSLGSQSAPAVSLVNQLGQPMSLSRIRWSVAGPNRGEHQQEGRGDDESKP
jgi:hypothetical protein